MKKMSWVILLIMVLAAGGSIPYIYESPSMLYKTGMEKMFLRTGKILGILAVILMVVQLVLISNFKFLTGLLKTRNRYQVHRINGLILLAGAVAHPVLILGADNFVFFPLETRYWPEILGGFLLVFLVIFVLFAVWQKKTRVSYPTWKRTHGTGAAFLFPLVFVHVRNVSETFAFDIPFYGLCGLTGMAGLLILKKILG